MFEDYKQQTRKRVLRESFRSYLKNVDLSQIDLPLDKQLERYKKHMEEEKKWKR